MAAFCPEEDPPCKSSRSLNGRSTLCFLCFCADVIWLVNGSKHFRGIESMQEQVLQS
jgi:hypothetical protein